MLKPNTSSTNCCFCIFCSIKERKLASFFVPHLMANITTVNKVCPILHFFYFDLHQLSLHQKRIVLLFQI